MLALVVLVIVFARVRLLEVPLERDEGEFAYEGQLMLDGVAPYQLVYHMKLPGTYAAYAVIMSIFGQTIPAIHFGFLLTNLATVLLVFMVGRRLMDLRGAAAAGISYALLSASPTVMGLSAHATHLVVLAAMGGLLLLLRARESGAGTTLFSSGALFGLSFVCKQPGLFFGLFGAAVLLRDETQSRPLEWRGCARKLGLYCAGMALPFALVCLAVWRGGTFKRFWFWTFAYAKVQTTLVPAETARYQLHSFLVNSGLMPWAWLLAGIGLITALRQSAQPGRRFILTALFGCSLLAFVTRLYFTGHYFIVMLPVVGLLTGIAITSAAGKLESTGRASAGALVLAVFLAGCAFFMYYNRAIWFQLAPEAVSRKMYGTNPFAESLVLGAYIRGHSAPGARIAVMGSEPEIYFYAHRHSATGYVNMYDLVQPHRYASQMQRELIQEVEVVKPEYFLYVQAPSSWLIWPGADPRLLDWGRQYTQEFYDLVGVTYIHRDHTEYAWGKGSLHNASGASVIYVFKRKA